MMTSAQTARIFNETSGDRDTPGPIVRVNPSEISMGFGLIKSVPGRWTDSRKKLIKTQLRLDKHYLKR
ncbi:hypothetical protein B0F90DRAFT_1704844 [Multifurca ochricompacta]|uniref:Uncharacterized protein n=1 Tax=Multifurca ochricompacta TaxID=376703 RepID=A0AAD4QML9_9AGAM|nr:hypothetical protein B0F90DRAFT_1704844 [Multifurca ochricompacta]